MSDQQPLLLQSELDQQRRQVDVDNYDLTLGEIVRMAEANELIRAPEYQRKFRWSEDDESYLIESLFLGLPVPSIYVASNPDGTWEVVDGLQRLSTLIHFMSLNAAALKQLGKAEPLRLVELRKLPSFINYRYADLPTPIRLQFAKRSLRVTALSDKSDPEIRFEVFERLNKGGVSLSAQEVRACIYRGPFSELLRELGDQPNFKKLVKLQPIHQNDGTREELVLKFFAYLNWAEKYDGNVKSFLNNYMKEAGPQHDLGQSRMLFDSVVDGILKITGGPLLRKGYGNTPLNQLEAVLVGAGRILISGKKLKTPPPDWLNDLDLVKASTKGTNTKTSFDARNGRAAKLLGG
ncbi:MAG: DUF262 domain-containing protein [Pelomonas sp.]|nr:DUF262 domain-containing protein [Roseateles sp.]